MVQPWFRFILADYDGVTVIPTAIKGEVHKKAMEKLARENVVRDKLAAGSRRGRFLIATGYCEERAALAQRAIFIFRLPRTGFV